MNILVTRTDRLGDVLLATPVLRKLRQTFPDAKITFLVQKQWMDLLQFPDIDLMEYRPGDKTLSEQVRAKSFTLALVLRDEKEVSRAIKRAKVPVRIGPYSSLRSFFVFNRGLLQRRSQCKMHEAEYNLKLLERMPNPIKIIPAQNSSDLPRSWIGYNKAVTQEVQRWLTQASLELKKYVCVHPGSSGSSRYLKTEVLCELIRTLKSKGVAVVLTGSAAEAELLSKTAMLAGVPEAHVFLGKPLSQLAELYRFSAGVVAHGTGPLHLAAAMDTNVFAIFPPIFVLSEKRWGPLTSKRYTWTPAVACPAFYQCHGEKCAYFDCMDRFMIDDSVQRILHWNNEKAHF